MQIILKAPVPTRDKEDLHVDRAPGAAQLANPIHATAGTPLPPSTRFQLAHSHAESSAAAPGRPVSEEESFREHRDALEATVFLRDHRRREVVLELEAGELRVRRSP